MKKQTYIIILASAFISVLVFEFFAYNSMVSLKYETKNITDCTSLVSGIDLCRMIKVFHLLAVLCGLIFIGFIIFKNRLIKKINV